MQNMLLARPGTKRKQASCLRTPASFLSRKCVTAITLAITLAMATAIAIITSATTTATAITIETASLRTRAFTHARTHMYRTHVHRHGKEMDVQRKVWAGHTVGKILDDSSTSFLVNSRTLMGCTDPLRRGVGAPRALSVRKQASSFMLTHGFTFR